MLWHFRRNQNLSCAAIKYHALPLHVTRGLNAFLFKKYYLTVISYLLWFDVKPAYNWFPGLKIDIFLSGPVGPAPLIFCGPDWKTAGPTIHFYPPAITFPNNANWKRKNFAIKKTDCKKKEKETPEAIQSMTDSMIGQIRNEWTGINDWKILSKMAAGPFCGPRARGPALF